MLSFTTGSQESMFSANGINGDMNVTLWPLQVFLFGSMFIIKLFQRERIYCLHQHPFLFIFSPEWHPALLWLPGSGSSDLLGPVSRSL